MTHSTGECRKYEKDGTLKASFRAAKQSGKKKNLSLKPELRAANQENREA